MFFIRQQLLYAVFHGLIFRMEIFIRFLRIFLQKTCCPICFWMWEMDLVLAQAKTIFAISSALLTICFG